MRLQLGEIDLEIGEIITRLLILDCILIGCYIKRFGMHLLPLNLAHGEPATVSALRRRAYGPYWER